MSKRGRVLVEIAQPCRRLEMGRPQKASYRATGTLLVVFQAWQWAGREFAEGLLSPVYGT